MQFKPPSNPGWIQPEPEPEQPQQEFPQQQAPRPFIQQLEQPTQPAWQEPQYPPRPETYYPPQQPMMPPPPPPKKRMRRNDKIALGIILTIVGVAVLIGFSAAIYAGASGAQSQSQANQQVTATALSSQLTATDVTYQETAVAVSNSITPIVTDVPVTPTPPPTVTQAPTFATFTDGTFQVGTDIQPGTYRTQIGSSGCYFARLKGFGGTTDDILANNLTDYPAIVTIFPSDKGFISQNCGTWTTDLSQITTSKTTFDDGMYIVGTDIQPGTYKNSGSSGCYYARLHGFSNSTNDIIANNLTDHPAIVTISASDKGFQSTKCGTWTKL
jgi:hypothetical protein